jgi:antirestriction protein ArdC
MRLRELRNSKNEKVRELYHTLVEGVREVLARADWRVFLDFLARFRRYSPANVALILAQCPGATWVAGLKTWNSLGRRVKRGEKGIAIFAPTLRKVRMRETDPETGEVREREEERLVGFHVTHVFDVSQTEGKPLPEAPRLRGEVRGDEEAARELFARLLAASPVPVEWAALDVDTRGLYVPAARRIYLARALERASWALKVRVLLHELAHALAFAMKVDGLGYRTVGGEGYARGEAIAEGAAYIAARLLGVDTLGMSTEYITGYVRQVEKLLEWAEAVHKVAEALVALAGSCEGREAA